MKQSLERLIAQYDHPDTTIVISLYPKKGEIYSAGTTGVASYSKNLVRHFDKKAIVLVDYHGKPKFYEEGNSLVIRCFKSNKKRLWLQIWQHLKNITHAKKVLIQLDLSMYGNSFVTAGIIPLIFLAKLYGKKIHVVSHHAVTDLNTLSGHMGLGSSTFDKIKTSVLNISLNSFYALLGLAAHKIIVLEDKLKKDLSKIINNKKIVNIPHAIDTEVKEITKNKARKSLKIPQSDKVVLFFGFANWFKGADFFAESFQNVSKLLGSKTQFIIAGGKSATLKDKPYYQSYFRKILDTVYQSKSMTITGYVPQEKIKEYFAAADVVVFPYRTFMCASGVMSLAFSYDKPFILSEELTPMLEGKDFALALDKAGLKTSQITFKLTKQDIKKRTESVLRNGIRQKMKIMCAEMQSERNFTKNAKEYEKLMFGSQLDFLPQNQVELAYES